MSKSPSPATAASNGQDFTGWEHASAATRLLQRRQQMFEVQEALENEKAQYAQREATFKKREQALEDKDLALQEHLVNFSKFLQEKDGQRLRHVKKVDEETKLRAQRQREIRDLEEKLKVLTRKQETLAAELRKNNKYTRYLTDVAESSNSFGEVQTIIDRWETLDEMQRDLQKDAERFITSHVEYRDKMLTLQQDKQGELLQSTTEIGKLKAKLEDLQTDAIKMADTAERQNTRAQERTLIIGQIKMACDNIYQRLQKRSTLNMPDMTSTAPTQGRAAEVVDPVTVLHKSGDVIEDLIAIVKERERE